MVGLSMLDPTSEINGRMRGQQLWPRLGVAQLMCRVAATRMSALVRRPTRARMSASATAEASAGPAVGERLATPPVV